MQSLTTSSVFPSSSILDTGLPTCTTPTNFPSNSAPISKGFMIRGNLHQSVIGKCFSFFEVLCFCVMYGYKTHNSIATNLSLFLSFQHGLSSAPFTSYLHCLSQIKVKRYRASVLLYFYFVAMPDTNNVSAFATNNFMFCHAHSP